MLAKPSAWNIGTASSVVSRARKGTLLSKPPISPSDLGSLRGAPFGVPVVPLVRITIFGDVPARGGALVLPPAMIESKVSSASSGSTASSSTQARQRPWGGSMSLSVAEYSSS